MPTSAAIWRKEGASPLEGTETRAACQVRVPQQQGCGCGKYTEDPHSTFPASESAEPTTAAKLECFLCKCVFWVLRSHKRSKPSHKRSNYCAFTNGFQAVVSLVSNLHGRRTAIENTQSNSQLIRGNLLPPAPAAEFQMRGLNRRIRAGHCVNCPQSHSKLGFQNDERLLISFVATPSFFKQSGHTIPHSTRVPVLRGCSDCVAKLMQAAPFWAPDIGGPEKLTKPFIGDVVAHSARRTSTINTRVWDLSTLEKPGNAFHRSQPSESPRAGYPTR